MEQFHYEAFTRQGQLVVGTERADSKQDLESLLKSRGLLPKSITKKSSLSRRITLGKKVSSSDFLIFVSELISLFKSGMGVPETIAILSEDDNSLISKELVKVLQEVKSGTSFSVACENSPNIFDNLFISALKTGESSGDMIRPLSAYYDHLERMIELKRKISQALIYPIFLVLTFSIVIIVMFVFVVPSFTSLYKDLSTKMPALTVWLLKIVNEFPKILLILAFLVLILVSGLRILRSKEKGRIDFDKMKEKIPFYGKTYSFLTYWQFSQALASLLLGGENLVSSIQIARNVSGNHFFVSQIDRVIKRVIHGESLSSSLKTETNMPIRSIKMISVGEESSNLVSMLDSVSSYFEKQVDDRVKKIILLIEPVIMLIIGVIVGVVIVGLYLPVFSMVNIIN